MIHNAQSDPKPEEEANAQGNPVFDGGHHHDSPIMPAEVDPSHDAPEGTE